MWLPASIQSGQVEGALRRMLANAMLSTLSATPTVSVRLTDKKRVLARVGAEEGVDFKGHFLRLRPDILAVTEDDKYGDLKRAL